VLADEHPGNGPTAAIVTALRATGSTFNIVTACDVPLVRTDVFAAMLDRIQRVDVQCVVPVTPDGREQVLCAVYRRDALSGLDCGEPRLRTAIRRLSVDFWPAESDEWALNLNTPKEWADFRDREAS
jgi:molybdopterin-guanine dinucleotide biosynthesis protein A